MKDKSKKKQIAKISIFIISIFIIFISVTYAFVTKSIMSEKSVVIKVGVLDLVLEEENEITISDALPMYDEVGMIQEDVFKFRLINRTTNPVGYKLKLSKISTGNELNPNNVKYYLTKDGMGTPKLLSNLPSDGKVESGTIGVNKTINYALRLWIDSSVTNKEEITGKSLSYKISVEASQEEPNEEVTFAGITKEVKPITKEMFNYSNEGCVMNQDTGHDPICLVEATNGLYKMEDDDGYSYFYRGKVDNLVKFGSYKEDYYVYYIPSTYSEYTTLAECQDEDPSCSESNKKLKYKAGTPMYWKIVRVNGNKTIRMIYSGTTPTADGADVGIGDSRYNYVGIENYYDARYAGYTYNRTTTETNSKIKDGIDNWYNTNFVNTIYDSYIVEEKFCSDSTRNSTKASPDSGNLLFNFAAYERNFANILGTGDASPTFKCPPTTESYGGSYNLKVGLMTLDEVVAAGGGQYAVSESNYLYQGNGFWTMTPIGVTERDGVLIGAGLSGGVVTMQTSLIAKISVRPVINLKSDITFKSGTNGTVSSPYEIVIK